MQIMFIAGNLTEIVMLLCFAKNQKPLNPGVIMH